MVENRYIRVPCSRPRVWTVDSGVAASRELSFDGCLGRQMVLKFRQRFGYSIVQYSAVQRSTV